MSRSSLLLRPAHLAHRSPASAHAQTRFGWQTRRRCRDDERRCPAGAPRPTHHVRSHECVHCAAHAVRWAPSRGTRRLGVGSVSSLLAGARSFCRRGSSLGARRLDAAGALAGTRCEGVARLGVFFARALRVFLRVFLSFESCEPERGTEERCVVGLPQLFIRLPRPFTCLVCARVIVCVCVSVRSCVCAFAHARVRTLGGKGARRCGDDAPSL